ncbi:MAG TPA: YceI family protein [Pyrinomonadaceae bacterium]|nr:YceI family protein [Pyrinomonadaceae bacterium]
MATSVARDPRVWQFDPAYSTVEFVVRNLWYNVKGRFNVLEGAIVLDEDDVRRSSITATIKANSIDTGNKRRDAHLQSADFLDVEKFPDIEFKSERIARGRDRDSLELDGILIVKDKRVPVSLAVNEMDRSRSPKGEEFIYYSATAELDRFACGVSYGRGMIGRKLKITINIQAASIHRGGVES